MTQEEALQVIDYHQKWRKGADVPQTDIKEISEALDLLSILVKEKDHEIAELNTKITALKSIIFNEKAKDKKLVAAMLEEVSELKAEIERLKNNTADL